MKSLVNRLRIAVPCLIFAAAAGSAASAATINVPANFPTIQAAIDAALPGDTILVAKGTYEEVLNIPITHTGLTLRGKKGAILDARPNGVDSGAAIVVVANTVTVRDLTIRHAADIVSNDGDGIRVTGTGFTGRNLTIQHCQGVGVALAATGALLDNVSIFGTDDGVSVAASTLTLRRVRTNGTEGAGITGTGSTIVVDRCTIRDANDNGIDITGATVTLTKNTVTNCGGTAIAITGDGATLTQNTVTAGASDGIVLLGNTGALTKNKLRSLGSTAIVISGNTANVTKNTADDVEAVMSITGTGNSAIGNIGRRVVDGFTIVGTTNNVGDNVLRDVSHRGFEVSGASSGTSLIANDIRNCVVEGILCSSDTVTIAGNSLRDCGNFSDAAILVNANSTDVTGNTVRNSRSDGIRVDGDSNSVAANVCQSNLEDGIDIEGGANNTLSNNNCSSNSAEGIENNGGNTTIQNCSAQKNRLDIANDGTLGAFNFNVFTTGGQATAPEVDG